MGTDVPFLEDVEDGVLEVEPVTETLGLNVDVDALRKNNKDEETQKLLQEMNSENLIPRQKPKLKLRRKMSGPGPNYNLYEITNDSNPRPIGAQKLQNQSGDET